LFHVSFIATRDRTRPYSCIVTFVASSSWSLTVESFQTLKTGSILTTISSDAVREMCVKRSVFELQLLLPENSCLIGLLGCFFDQTNNGNFGRWLKCFVLHNGGFKWNALIRDKVRPLHDRFGKLTSHGLKWRDTEIERFRDTTFGPMFDNCWQRHQHSKAISVSPSISA